MNYADELVSMLRPLGVYSFQEGSFSLAELQALGAALDAADEAFGAAQKESIVMTAQDEGLSKMEALNRCLCACGVACSVEETGEVNRVKVWFPGVMGIPDGFAEAKIIIEDILPCQMGITYWFRYCTWQETQDYGLTWADVNAMTWHEWETYHEDPA